MKTSMIFLWVFILIPSIHAMDHDNENFKTGCLLLKNNIDERIDFDVYSLLDGQYDDGIVFKHNNLHVFGCLDPNTTLHIRSSVTIDHQEVWGKEIIIGLTLAKQGWSQEFKEYQPILYEIAYDQVGKPAIKKQP